MFEKILIVLAGLVACFAIPYILTSMLSKKNQFNEEDIKMLDSEREVCICIDGEYQLMDVEEYVIYAMAGEVDMSWSDEMLKVMAVITRTSIYKQMEDLASKNDGNAGLVNEAELQEIRYEKSELSSNWGDKYESNMERIYNAVKATCCETITYNSSYIIPYYHEISIGNTVSAKELYGEDVPYLQSVDSSVDVSANGFSTSQIISHSRLAKLFSINAGASGSITISSVTDMGFVKTIKVFGTDITGEEFARKLDLPSTNIHIEETNQGTQIISIGRGSSLGLSLFGANEMTKQGNDYKTVLEYYYANCKIA